MFAIKMRLIKDHDPYGLKEGDAIVVFDAVINVNSSLDPGVKIFFMFYCQKLADWAFLHASFVKPDQGPTLTIPKGAVN